MSDSERARSGVGRPVEISPRGPLGSDRVAFHAYSGGSAYQRVRHIRMIDYRVAVAVSLLRWSRDRALLNFSLIVYRIRQ